MEEDEILVELELLDVDDMPPHDLTDEEYREYDFGGRVYRIDAPEALYIGRTTHRVVALDGIVHCVPAPGFGDCVVRWKPRDGSRPVQF